MGFRICASAVVAAALMATLAGCQTGQLSEMGPNSHFVFPNSNVTALGPVKVSLSGEVGFFSPPTIKTGELDATVYNKAIRQVVGADMVIDYVRTTRLYMFPFLPIFWTDVQLEGTAAKMELGKQSLK